jgi:hypothetical protein
MERGKVDGERGRGRKRERKIDWLILREYRLEIMKCSCDVLFTLALRSKVWVGY